jgi:hypothetical protein
MKKKLLALVAALGVTAALLAPATALAIEPFQDACKAPGAAAAVANSAACTTQTGGNPVVDTMNKIGSLLLIIAAPAAVIIITVAGIIMVASGGDSGKVATARRTIIYTAVGLVVLIFARVIIGFVITNVYK